MLGFFKKAQVYLIIILIIFFGTAYCSLGSTLNNSKQETTSHCEFTTYEKSSLSPDGCWLTYTVNQKLENVSKTGFQLPDGTPLYGSGSQIYLLSLNSKILKTIGPSVGDSWRPSISPDSQKIAFYSNAGGFPQLWIYEIITGKNKKLCDLPIQATNFCLDAAQWSPDSKKIYIPVKPNKEIDTEHSDKNITNFANLNLPTVSTFKSPKEESFELDHSLDFSKRFYLSSLTCIDVDNGNVQSIVPSNSKSLPMNLEISPSGQWLSYISIPKFEDNPAFSTHSLNAIRADGKGETEVIVEDLILGDPNKTPYSWHFSKDLLTYVKNKKLYVVEFDEKGPKEPKQILPEGNYEFNSEPLIYTSDGQSIIVGIRPYLDGYRNKPASLAIISLEDFSIIEIPFGKDWKLEDLLHSGNQAWQPISENLILSLNNVHTCETVFAKVVINDQNIFSKFEPLWSKVASLRNICCNPNNFDLFAHYEDLNTTENIYKFSNDFSDFKQITDINPSLKKLSIYEKHVFETTVTLFDGKNKNVRTSIILPLGIEKSDKVPAIVKIYPGANHSDHVKYFCQNDMIFPISVLLDEGYALILCDVPIGPEGTPCEPLQEIVDVLLPQVYHAGDIGYIDINRIGIIGHSYGAYGAVGAVCKTNLFKACAALSGCYDLPGTYSCFRRDLNDIYTSYYEHGQGRMGDMLWNDIQRYQRNSPLYLADQIKTPVLFIHGEQDTTCVVSESQKMFGALLRLKCPAELCIYKDEEHVISDWKQSNSQDVNIQMIRFFDRHLK